MRAVTSIAVTCLLVLTLQGAARAGIQDWLDRLTGGSESGTPTAGEGGLSQQEVARGLKEALSKGTRYAVEQLGRTDGFLGNDRVRIPLPPALRPVEKTLRRLGQDRYADAFVKTMNRAAEKAVSEAGPIFANAVKQLTVQDAMDILRGPDDAATRYFRNKTEGALTDKMLPIVRTATANAGVTGAYKDLYNHLGFARSLVDRQDVDLDRYVTDKAMDGLFTMIAEEEAKIRRNPVARTTDLLKRVFGHSLK